MEDCSHGGMLGKQCAELWGQPSQFTLLDLAALGSEEPMTATTLEKSS